MTTIGRAMEAVAEMPAVGRRSLLATLETITVDIDTGFLWVAGTFVFLMQAGFCMLAVGSVRAKNARNIVLKSLLDACFGAIGWYLTGYAFAYGDNTDADGNNVGNGFIGTNYFALSNMGADQYISWFFQYAFAASTATIVSGAVTERTKFTAYIMYALFLTMWVYPVIAHWCWSGAGWAGAFRADTVGPLLYGCGVMDFAGSGVVHLTGGVAAFCGSYWVGPRKGRFDTNGKAVDLPGHSAPLAILGVFILWFGWYGFNPGSALILVDASEIVARCAVTTTLAGACGGVSALLFGMLVSYVQTKKVTWDLMAAGNGVLGGLVSITSGTATVRPWAAVIIGLAGGIIMWLGSRFILHVCKVDDPVDAIAVHGVCGVWGVIAAGLFASGPATDQSYGTPEGCQGVLQGGNGKMLGANIVWVLVVIGWTSAFMCPFFGILKVLGMLRVNEDEELKGLDESHHGGAAYAYDLPPVNGAMNGKGGVGIGGDTELATLRAEISTLTKRVSTLEGGGAAQV